MLLLACGSAAIAPAQWNQITVGNKTIDIHGFFSQGFAASDQNNFLTMKTSQGSFAMTDFGVNASSQITDNFRVGAQLYDRNIGNLGQWHPQLDWAYGDYKLKDWLGVRAGKVKTVLGLYNDTQDIDFLHTFALLPQSVYPSDLRASTIAHLGADIYGTVPVRRFGEISYTAYAGKEAYDRYGGYPYGTAALGVTIDEFHARQVGGDLRWSNLINGLTFGASFLSTPGGTSGSINLQKAFGSPVPLILPYDAIVEADNRLQYYAEYKRNRLTLQGEYSRETWGIDVHNFEKFPSDTRAWYTAAAYRINKHLELGTYHSRFYPNWKQANLSTPGNHIFDQAATANISLTSFWDLKLEGHFMDGYGVGYSFRNFYPQDNPQGLKAQTNLFVIRTGFNF